MRIFFSGLSSRIMFVELPNVDKVIIFIVFIYECRCGCKIFCKGGKHNVADVAQVA